MISAIIPTLDSVHGLERTLAALVAGAADGLIKQVIVADAGSIDDTVAIANAAGCDVVHLPELQTERLIAGVRAAKAKWLMFLYPGMVLNEECLEETRRFIERESAERAASFTYGVRGQAAFKGEMIVNLSGWLLKRPLFGQGLLISRVFYDAIGGYRAVADAHGNLLGRIGRTRMTILPARVFFEG